MCVCVGGGGGESWELLPRKEMGLLPDFSLTASKVKMRVDEWYDSRSSLSLDADSCKSLYNRYTKINKIGLRVTLSCL